MTEPTGQPPATAGAHSSSIFLIGPMGSGKSAVGRTLARLCDRAFIDSDVEIERRTGVDINFIFEKEGEPGFRAREREVIEDLTQRPGIVLATGGGAVMLPENRAALAARGVTVYLEASVQQQVERPRRGRHRPLLLSADPAVRLAELMQLREPLYRGTAQIVVSTDRRKVQVVAEQILAELVRRQLL